MTQSDVKLTKNRYAEGMESESIRKRIGANVKRLRELRGFTAEELAKQMKYQGFTWSASRVSELENGNKSVSISELLGLAWGITGTEFPVHLADLFEGDTPVELTDTWDISTDGIQAAFRGEKMPHDISHYPKSNKRFWSAISNESPALADLVAEMSGKKMNKPTASPSQVTDADFDGAAEMKARKALGISSEELRSACLALWGKSLTAERDRRGAGLQSQAKGHITRQLIAELSERLGKSNGDD